MFALIIWIVVLLCLLFVCIAFSGRSLLTPQVVYVGCFLPQAIFSLNFVKKWNIKLSAETMFVLIGGTTLFVAASIFFDRMLSRADKPAQADNSGKSIHSSPVIYIERWKLIVFLLLQIISIIIYIVYGLSRVPGSTLLEKMAYYDSNIKFGDVEDWVIFPKWVSWPRIISSTSCYVIGYLLLHGIIFKYKQNRYLLSLNLVAGVLNYVLLGSRINIVGMIIGLVVQAYFIWGSSINWSKKVSPRMVSRIILIGVIILLVFQWSLQFLGRSSKTSLVDYLGVYIAAPLRNLDVFVRSRDYGNGISNWETLQPLVNFIGRTFGINEWVHQHDLPFLTLHGMNVGNVYTLYYHYLHDGGHVAVIGFVIFEAFTTQVIYHRVLRKSCHSGINLSLILYSYTIYAISLGFFMERFYALVFTSTMVKTIICWWILSFFFTKLRFTWKSKQKAMVRENLRLNSY